MRRALIPIAIVCAAAGVAAGNPSEDLDRARDNFRSGNYADASHLLSFLLYPPPARLAQPQDLVEAHVLFGACAFESGDPATATREFEEALSLAPGYTLDKKIFSDGAVRFFDETKRAVEERARHDAELRALAEEKERLKRYRESLVVYEVHPYYVNFIPFGAGQFQNGQRSKGLWFASTEATTGAISAGIWIYLVGTYGFDGRVKLEDQAFARRLQQIEIGAGGVCLGLMAWGIVDSLLHYHPRTRVEGDDSILPPDLRPAKPKGPPREPDSRFSISPAVIPDGAGVVFTWER
jgi:hypothetical protein